MSVQAKFKCSSMSKYATTTWDTEGKTHKEGFAYSYEFHAVTGDSPENKIFFSSTPGGNLKLSSVRDDLFVPGKSYYLNFVEAES